MAFAGDLAVLTYQTGSLNTLQYQLTRITNAMMELTRESSAVYDEQNAEMQRYLNNCKDEEGQIDTSKFDYINSSLWQAPFQAKLSRIKSKEQQMQQEKLQVETRIKALEANKEGEEKILQKNLEKMFGYYK